MRFLTADYLYPLNSKPLRQGVLQINDRGEVCSIFEDRGFVCQMKGWKFLQEFYAQDL